MAMWPTSKGLSKLSCPIDLMVPVIDRFHSNPLTHDRYIYSCLVIPTLSGWFLTASAYTVNIILRQEQLNLWGDNVVLSKWLGHTDTGIR